MTTSATTQSPPDPGLADACCAPLLREPITASQAADLARSSWLRIKADMALGGYQIHLAEGTLPDPVWPDKTFQQLLTIAFRNRIIDGSDHPIIRKHRGLS